MELVDKLNEFFVIGVAAYILRGWVAAKVVRFGRKMLVKTERDQAIVTHFANQMAGKGHQGASPVGCGEGKCVVFGSVPQTA